MRLSTAIRDALLTIPAFQYIDEDTPGLLPGGIYDQPLVPPEVVSDLNPGNDEGPTSEYMVRATPKAFNDDVAMQARRSMSIIVPEPTPGLFNWTEQRGDLVDIYLYGPETDADEALLEQARRLTRAFLTSRFLRPEPEGSGCVINPQGVEGEFHSEPALIFSISSRSRFIVAWF